MKGSTAVAEIGWFEKIKSMLKIDTIIEKMNLSQSRLVEIGIYLGIGFLAGFLFKKWGKYLFVVVLTLVGLALLQHYEFINIVIDWGKVQGIQPIPTPSGSSILTVYGEWVKGNFAVVLSFSVGFLVGFKVG